MSSPQDPKLPPTFDDLFYDNRLLNKLFEERKLQTLVGQNEELIDNEWIFRIIGTTNLDDFITKQEKYEKLVIENPEDYDRFDLEDAFAAVRSINQHLRPQFAVGPLSPKIDFESIISEIGSF